MMWSRDKNRFVWECQRLPSWTVGVSPSSLASRWQRYYDGCLFEKKRGYGSDKGGIYSNRLVEDFNAVFASSLVCYLAYSVPGILSQSCLAYFYMYSHLFLSEVYNRSGNYAQLGIAGRVSAVVCTTWDRLHGKKV